MKQKLFSKSEIKFSLEKLKIWFEEEKRDFPWRKHPTPYGVWVSEVMLQQTQAIVVVPYFKRWMERLPTIEKLSAASEDEVIKLWEGLGYYSRARALHQGAQFIMQHHGGILPSERDALLKVKGIGPYTAGAILSFAFHQKAAAVDGNVLRVISRLFLIEEEVDRPGVQKKIQEIVEELLPDSQSFVMMESMIELGARICMRRPACLICPLQDSCLGYLTGKAEGLPKRKQRQSATLLKRRVLIITNGEDFLVQKQSGNKVMHGLYEFPYFQENENWQSFYPGELVRIRELTSVSHTFTRYKAELSPSLLEAKVRCEINGFSWLSLDALKKLPFSSGHRKILSQLLEEYAHITH